MMDAVTWWVNMAVLAVACVVDVRTRRIPNWLVGPFLVAGLATQIFHNGLRGVEQSLAGMALAAALFALPCFLRAMGMGDLKLAAGVGAWVGPAHMITAFVVTSIVGGVMAIGYAWWKGALGTAFDKTGDLLADLAHLRVSRTEHNAGTSGGKTDALSIPYAPAIAIGTLFTFFAQ